MTTKNKTICQRRRCLREAEGYLELATLFDDQFALDQTQKTLLANMCLKTLLRIDKKQRRRARFFYLSGQAHRLAQRYGQAIADLQSAWEMNSTNIHTCLALGWCFKRTGQMERAIASLQNALEIDEDSGILHYNLSCYMALREQAELALVHLARAIEIDSRFRLLAAGEEDFDSIRDEPGFRELAEALA